MRPPPRASGIHPGETALLLHLPAAVRGAAAPPPRAPALPPPPAVPPRMDATREACVRNPSRRDSLAPASAVGPTAVAASFWSPRRVARGRNRQWLRRRSASGARIAHAAAGGGGGGGDQPRARLLPPGAGGGVPGGCPVRLAQFDARDLLGGDAGERRGHAARVSQRGAWGQALSGHGS